MRGIPPMVDEILEILTDIYESDGLDVNRMTTNRIRTSVPTDINRKNPTSFQYPDHLAAYRLIAH